MKHVDAIVIGSGAAGGVVAKELSTAGRDVVLLERGHWVTPFECGKDDWRSQRTQVLGAAFGPPDQGNPRVRIESDGTRRIVYASRGGYNHNTTCVGGGTANYGAMAGRYMAQDFRMKSACGAVEGSTLEDSPISYDDIGPGAGIAICDYNHNNPGMAGGGMLCNSFITLPYHFVNVTPPWVPKWGIGHREFLRHYYRRTIKARGLTREMPVWESRVQLDPKVKDRWGILVVQMSGYQHPHPLEIARCLARMDEEWVKEAGAIKTWLRISRNGLSGG